MTTGEIAALHPSASIAPEQQSAHTSKGEQLFNWGVYGGIAGVGVFLASLPVAYWAKHGGGAPLFKKAAQSLTKAGMSEGTAEQLLMTTALMQGGNLGLIPVMAAEKRKPELVEKCNRAIGVKDAPAAIEAKTQSWGSMIKSRLLAFSAVFLTFKGTSMIAGEERFANFERGFAEHIVCNPLGKPTHLPSGQETKFFRYGKLAALDVIATAGAAALLFLGSRFFAEKEQKKAESLPPAVNVPQEQAESPLHMRQDHAALIAARSRPPRRAAPAGGFSELVGEQKAAMAENGRAHA